MPHNISAKRPTWVREGHADVRAWLTVDALVVGNRYTRDQVADLVPLSPRQRKGNWLTGYSSWAGSMFVFCNVGVPGRTGHDYGNRWDGKDLIWFGKVGSTATQPTIKTMIAGIVDCHIFWRGTDRAAFTYAGRGRVSDVRAVVPVQLRWSFGATGPSEHEPPSSPSFRRGPPPVQGPVSYERSDGETALYLMILANGSEMLSLLPGQRVIKVGISNNVEIRLLQLNFGFPPGSKARWELVAFRPFPTGALAFSNESALLEQLRVGEKWIGGEYAVVDAE